MLPALLKTLPPSPPAAIAKVRELEAVVSQAPQVGIKTFHVLHAGVYSRTICIPKGVVLTSALIKIPTTLTVCGKASVFIGDEEVLIEGYQVLAASAGRKQAYIAHEDTYVTMAFCTDARTVEACEEQFTDEAAMLMSRFGDNEINITED